MAALGGGGVVLSYRFPIRARRSTRSDDRAHSDCQCLRWEVAQVSLTLNCATVLLRIDTGLDQYYLHESCMFIVCPCNG